jgi:hypothetical protein
MAIAAPRQTRHNITHHKALTRSSQIPFDLHPRMISNQAVQTATHFYNERKSPNFHPPLHDALPIPGSILFLSLVAKA